MNIEIYGSTKNTRQLVEYHILNILSILNLKDSNSIIDISLSGNLDADGYAYGQWIRNSFSGVIELNSSIPTEEFVLTIAHEMMHIKQYYDKRLEYIGLKLLFEHENCSDITYENRPWEKEATEFEKIYLQYIKNII